jgi:hypothetical protein
MRRELRRRRLMCVTGHYGADIVKVDGGHGIFWIPTEVGVFASFWREKGERADSCHLPKHLKERHAKGEWFCLEAGWYFGDNIEHFQLVNLAKGNRSEYGVLEKMLRSVGVRIDLCNDHVVPFAQRGPGNNLLFERDMRMVIKDFPDLRYIMRAISLRDLETKR